MNFAPMVENIRKRHIILKYLSLNKSTNPTLLAFFSPYFAWVAVSKLKDRTNQTVKTKMLKQAAVAATSKSSVSLSMKFEIIGMEKMPGQLLIVDLYQYHQ